MIIGRSANPGAITLPPPRPSSSIAGAARCTAELDKWQRVENQFVDFAERAFAATGTSPQVAALFGIKMPPYSVKNQQPLECKAVRPPWVSQRSAFCQKKYDEYQVCLRNFEAKTGPCTADIANRPGGECWAESKFTEPCQYEDYAAVS